MSGDAPTITVLIPARNEQKDIERCLRAVLAQDHPHDRMEIVLVDGGSVDRTAEIARRVLAGADIPAKIIDNPVGTTPSSLNVGLAAATGEILCRVDARSVIPSHYVRLCAEVLQRRADVRVTGGAQVAVGLDDSPHSRGIARALNNRFLMGGSRYRSGASSGPSDTVYLGAFRIADLRAAGGWDDFFHTNQDFELNRRLARTGTVWYDDRIEVRYVPRQTVRALWRQYYRFGRWKVRYWRRTGDAPRPRQALLLTGAGGVLLTAGASVLASRRRVRRGVLSMVAAWIGALAVDAVGSAGKPGFGERSVGAAASIAISCGWLAGIAREYLQPGVAPESGLAS